MSDAFRLGRTAISTLLLATAVSGCTSAPDRGVPEEVIRHNIVGVARMGQTKWTEAHEEFEKALALRGDDPLLLTNDATALIQMEEIDRARELLERAVAIDPDYAPAHFNLGLIANRLGDFEQAAERFTRVTELESGDLYAYYFLGTSLGRIGREAEAIEALRAALARDPAHVSTLYALGRLLLQQGDQEAGMQMITRSQEIRARSGLDEAVGGEYGEQGRLSRAADYPGDALEAPAAIPVSFAGAIQVGLEPGVTGVALTTTPSSGGVELYVAQRASVLQMLPPGRSEPVTSATGDRTRIATLRAGDLNDDGQVDLAALLVAGEESGPKRLVPAWTARAEDGGHGPLSTESFSGEVETPLEGGLAGLDLALLDRDHDGDLDLVWCWSVEGASGGCKLATNDGKGRFEVRGSAELGFRFETAPGPVTVAFSDVDNDRDIDLLVGSASGVRLLSNERDGRFTDVSAQAALEGTTSGVRSMTVADLNKDGWMDLLLVGEGGVRLVPNHGGRFEAATTLDEAGVGHGIVFDLDNDGFLDVAVATSSGPLALHNRGVGRWEPLPDLLRPEGLPADAAPVASLDADGDGDADLVLTDGGGAVTLLSNEGGNAGRWIDLDSRGVGDNHFGIGAKVEVLAGALRQKFEVTSPVALHVGLGSRETVQAVRYLWPSGVLQDEIELASGVTTEIAQLDRKGTSCPLLYAWGESGWRFVTDFLGGAAVGYQHAPGVYGTPDTDEYVRIEGGLVETEDGLLKLRLNNQLEEVIWFDQVQLVVVDHPLGTEVYPDERLMPAPPFPEFRLFASDDVRPIVSARGVGDGVDETARLAETDRRYVTDFELLRPKGYAAPHALEMDLGPFPDAARVVLLLDGWIDYADSSANVAASQTDTKLVPPWLRVADGRGGWIDVGDGRMGFPAGLPKTMAVELTGLFPGEDHRVRIGTSMRIYWDRARVMIGGEDTPLGVTRLGAESAELRFGGFPRPTSPDGAPPRLYDPDDVAASHAWKAHVGVYTGFGNVTALLSEIDDRFVTTRNGDEIELTFRSPGPVPRGRARTYLLFADGFGKDMDPNSAAGDEVGPIPFHGMPGYPYPADVVPPVVQDSAGLVPRRVTASDEGWPGALPFGRHAVD